MGTGADDFVQNREMSAPNYTKMTQGAPQGLVTSAYDIISPNRQIDVHVVQLNYANYFTSFNLDSVYCINYVHLTCAVLALAPSRKGIW